MKTKPFSASSYDPARDKLVCGGDPVTELLIGDYHVTGLVRAPTCKYVASWDRNGAKWHNTLAPLEVLIPEPREKEPPELFDGFAVLQELGPKAKTRTSPENVADVLDAVVRLMRKNRREVPDPEEAKAVEQQQGSQVVRQRPLKSPTDGSSPSPAAPSSADAGVREALRPLANIPIEDFGKERSPDYPLMAWSEHTLYVRDVLAARAALSPAAQQPTETKHE